MNQKTAVEWLVEEINKQKAWVTPQQLESLIDYALKIEKEQIINAVEYGCSDWGSGKDAEEYYDINYKGKLTFKEKQQWLRDNGWRTSWSEDNWLQRDEEYSNPDWAGMSTEHAYEHAMKYRKPSTIAEVEEWEKQQNK
jgi:hypothetical protein